jgi:cellulose synthase/poly-beta-1,6-N-acetylglucosamine synthase-like glycosyltransferase
MTGDARRTDEGGISVVVPTLNDRDGLEELLNALAAQTRAPDEVVVVDGGSTDGTMELLEAWRADSRVPVKVVRGSALSIGAARNVGVQAASHHWIACTDAGCRPVPRWLAAIDAARREADFIAGVVIIEGRTPFERALALTHYPSTEELDDPALLVRVSHRLFGRGYDPDRVGGAYMAFTKPLWSAVGGFPAGLAASEDHAFSSAVVAKGFRVARAPDAAVRWQPPGSWLGNAAMFLRYSRADIRVKGRARHVIRAAAWAGAVIALLRGGWRARLVLALGATGYVALPMRRARVASYPLRQCWRIPVLVAVKDLSQIVGMLVGILDAMRARRRRPDEAG